MKYTENFHLKKPEGSDFYNIEDFNGNMDMIDAGCAWQSIPAEAFIDLDSDVNDFELKNVQAWYQPLTRMVYFTGSFVSTDIAFAGMTDKSGYLSLGKIKEPYSPLFSDAVSNHIIAASYVDSDTDIVEKAGMVTLTKGLKGGANLGFIGPKSDHILVIKFAMLIPVKGA
ncbi:MAG: hypothetical protein IJ766_01145 [Clostridia bacterium]|nr:hypothetical protein [Clostridia bacterium]